jgi:hypothetical protein
VNKGQRVVVDVEMKNPPHPREGQEGEMVGSTLDPDVVLVMFDEDSDERETVVIHFAVKNLRLV